MKRAFVWCCCFAVMMAPAYAEEALDLGQIVVTPYRYEGAMSKASSSMTVITRQDIADSHAVKLVDVLRNVPGLMLKDWYGNGTKAAVDIAGFGEQSALNVLVLLDGRRVNNVDLSGVDWSQVPLEDVERIEILRGGAGGVLYGSNASSGVINIITKRGAGAPQVEMSTGYGSYDRNAQRLSVGGGVDNKLSYRLSAGRDATHGYRQNAFSKEQDLLAKASYELTQDLSVHLDTGFHTARYGMPGALYQDNIDQNGRRYSRTPRDHANNIDNYIVVGAESGLAQFGRLAMDFSYRHNRTDSYFPAVTPSLGNPTRLNKIRTYGLTPRYTIDERVFGHDNKFIAGMDYYQTLFDSDNHNKTTDALSSYTNIRKVALAQYVQDEFGVTDALSMTGGYRRETVRYAFGYHDCSLWSPDIDTRLKPHREAYNSGLVYTYGKDRNAFVNVSQSYRFPEADEFTYTDADFKQQLKTSLKPQSSVNYQLGVRHKFTDALKAQASVFRMNVKDELFYNAKYAYIFDGWSWDWSGQNDNYARTMHQGVETSLEAKLNEHLTMTGNYTFTDARFDGGVYDGRQIPLVARHKVGTGMELALSPKLTLNVAGAYVGSRYFYNDQANAYSPLSGYFVADAGVTWRLKDVSVAFGVNNIFNREYAEMAGVRVNEDGVYGYHTGDKFYYPSPGRNFDLTVNYKF